MHNVALAAGAREARENEPRPSVALLAGMDLVLPPSLCFLRWQQLVHAREPFHAEDREDLVLPPSLCYYRYRSKGRRWCLLQVDTIEFFFSY